MPDFLSDPSPTTYLLLAALVVVTGVVAARYQDRKRIAAFGVAVILLVGLYLCDRFFDSPREEAVAVVGRMIDAVNRGDADAFVDQLAMSFEVRGMNRQQLRQAIELAHRNNIRITTWNFDRSLVVFVDGKHATVEIAFDAKAAGPGGEIIPRHVRMKFFDHAGSGFKLQSFTTYNILQKTVEEPIPGVSK